jgi:hypothetical protein
MVAVETGWTDPQARGLAGTFWTQTATLPRLGPRVRIPSSAPKVQVKGLGSTIAPVFRIVEVYYQARKSEKLVRATPCLQLSLTSFPDG